MASNYHSRFRLAALGLLELALIHSRITMDVRGALPKRRIPFRLQLGRRSKGKSWDVEPPINIDPIKPGDTIAAKWDFPADKAFTPSRSARCALRFAPLAK